MPTARGLRLLNSLQSGGVNGTCLESLLSGDAGRLADFSNLVSSPTSLKAITNSPNAMCAITNSYTAMCTIFGYIDSASLVESAVWNNVCWANNMLSNSCSRSFFNQVNNFANNAFCYFDRSACAINSILDTTNSFISLSTITANTSLVSKLTCSANTMKSLYNSANEYYQCCVWTNNWHWPTKSFDTTPYGYCGISGRPESQPYANPLIQYSNGYYISIPYITCDVGSATPCFTGGVCAFISCDTNNWCGITLPVYPGCSDTCTGATYISVGSQKCVPAGIVNNVLYCDYANTNNWFSRSVGCFASITNGSSGCFFYIPVQVCSPQGGLTAYNYIAYVSPESCPGVPCIGVLTTSTTSPESCARVYGTGGNCVQYMGNMVDFCGAWCCSTITSSWVQTGRPPYPSVVQCCSVLVGTTLPSSERLGNCCMVMFGRWAPVIDGTDCSRMCCICNLYGYGNFNSVGGGALNNCYRTTFTNTCLNRPGYYVSTSAPGTNQWNATIWWPCKGCCWQCANTAAVGSCCWGPAFMSINYGAWYNYMTHNTTCMCNINVCDYTKGGSNFCAVCTSYMNGYQYGYNLFNTALANNQFTIWNQNYSDWYICGAVYIPSTCYHIALTSNGSTTGKGTIYTCNGGANYNVWTGAGSCITGHPITCGIGAIITNCCGVVTVFPTTGSQINYSTTCGSTWSVANLPFTGCWSWPIGCSPIADRRINMGSKDKLMWAFDSITCCGVLSCDGSNWSSFKPPNVTFNLANTCLWESIDANNSIHTSVSPDGQIVIINTVCNFVTTNW